MTMTRSRRWTVAAGLALALAVAGLQAQPVRPAAGPQTDEAKLLAAMHLIQSQPLYNYVAELVSGKYGGRLTGTKEYEACVAWIESLLKGWGIEPGGDGGTYRQLFPNPYTIVFPGGVCEMAIPAGRGGTIRKAYRYEDEFIPGGTSGSGTVTAEVVYAGYGVTAPELGYDDYGAVDVKGKIVLVDPEVPVGPGGKTIDLFKKWRPYSFHQYKLRNAAAHGAAGLIYNYGPIGNPNNAYVEGFVYHHVGRAVVADVFAGTGRTHADVAARIRKELKPQSFATGKTMTIGNRTEHHPDGIGINLVGKITGSDPALKDEVIIVGGHLDHLGRMWELLPGANDNASAVAVTLGLAEAMAKCAVKPRRTVVFFFFGSEEQSEDQGTEGSHYYTEHPLYPLDKTVVFINMEGPGSGDRIGASGGPTYPGFWKFVEKANAGFIHRALNTYPASYPARPRQDSAWFFWKGVPSLTFGADGGPEPPYPTYHNTRDSLELITPEIMEDIAQLLFMTIMDISDEPAVDFR
ncbi:MAG TPA: M28 family peptidase [Candidatus Aminicenantes bacterium]|nr:M28 family peptidase [Candidatus Aminicenantes bacterium]HRY65092.1 M28 family peptidase [Candidatus Aminicenantes bacterium]HRZ72005.1 M28 family peptidase [Candidatus Aminicenantes bacterium]